MIRSEVVVIRSEPIRTTSLTYYNTFRTYSDHLTNVFQPPQNLLQYVPDVFRPPHQRIPTTSEPILIRSEPIRTTSPTYSNHLGTYSNHLGTYSNTFRTYYNHLRTYYNTVPRWSQPRSGRYLTTFRGVFNMVPRGI